MKKKAVIKSEKSLSLITGLIKKKVYNKVFSIYGDAYSVNTEEVIKGQLNRIIVSSRYHMLTKSAMDSVWEIIDEYENKYDNCVFGIIDTRPYLDSNGEIWLHEPVIEITVRIYDL